ncbi:MAG: OsmC family protein [Fuerstiella sp.]
MNSEQLKALQAPLKTRYVDSPTDASVCLNATGAINIDDLTCNVEVAPSVGGRTVSGLHPNAGGDGSAACSGDMLLQSLVACSGVTFAAVSTAMGMQISSASVSARGTMDFRGTLGVDRDVPIGLTSVELSFAVETSEPDEKIEKLIQLTERYCVVLQTLKNGVAVSSRRD